MFISVNKPLLSCNIYLFCFFLTGPAKVTVRVENGIVKQKCSKCQEEFLTLDAVKFHMKVSKYTYKHTKKRKKCVCIFVSTHQILKYLFIFCFRVAVQMLKLRQLRTWMQTSASCWSQSFTTACLREMGTRTRPRPTLHSSVRAVWKSSRTTSGMTLVVSNIIFCSGSMLTEK